MNKLNMKRLKELANSSAVNEELAKGILDMAKEIKYLNGCVQRGRGSDIYPDEPCRNVFNYILELEQASKVMESLLIECVPNLFPEENVSLLSDIKYILDRVDTDEEQEDADDEKAAVDRASAGSTKLTGKA